MLGGSQLEDTLLIVYLVGDNLALFSLKVLCLFNLLIPVLDGFFEYLLLLVDD